MITTPTIAVVLPPALKAFMQQGVSISLSSRDIRHVPSLSRGLACRVDDGAVILFLVTSQAEVLLRDLQRSGRGAVVFSRPRTHQTIQIKGDLLEIRAPETDEGQLIEAQVTALQRELLELGFSEPMLHCFYRYDWADLAAVCLAPTAIFEQTPGPRAGQRMEATP